MSGAFKAPDMMICPAVPDQTEGLLLPPMKLMMIEIMASTKRICIMLPTLYTKSPSAQPMTSITAMT